MTTTHKRQYSQLLDTHNKTPVNCVDTSKIFNNNSPDHPFTVPRCTLLFTTQSLRQSIEATIPFPVFFPPCCLTTTESVGIIRDGSPGRPPPLSNSSWVCCPYFFILFLQCCFMSIETVGLLGTGSPGRPPPLSKKLLGLFSILLHFFSVALRPQRP